MKKILFSVFVVLFSLSFSALNAQTNLFEKGSLNFSAGYGIVPTFISDGGSVNIPPLSARIGYSLNNHVNVSGYFGYSATSTKPHLYSDGLLATYQNDFMIFGLRTELHAAKSKKFDLYGGFMLGYNHPIVKELAVADGTEIIRDSNEPSPFQQPTGKLLYTGFIGATYAIHNNLGVFAEAGYGISMLNVGLTVKL